MTDFRKNDEVSMRGLITGAVAVVGEPVVKWSDGWACTVDPKLLTLIRRAPVDLATCELPVRVQETADADVKGVLVHRFQRSNGT